MKPSKDYGAKQHNCFSTLILIVMKALLRTIKVLNEIPNQRTQFGSTYELIPELDKLRLHIARMEWSNLSEVSIDENGEILNNYTVFAETEDEFTFMEGTDREEIWSWFEETFNLSVHDDLMFNQGI